MTFESGNGCGSSCAPLPGPGGRGGIPAARSGVLFGKGLADYPFAACAENAAVIQHLVNGVVEGDGREPIDDIRVCIHEASHAAVGWQWSALGGMTCVPGDGFSGRCWGPTFKSTFASDHETEPSLCERLAPQMPSMGESRAACADIYLYCFQRVIESVSGTEGERLFCDGEPWFATGDERQAIAYASLITSSPAAAAAFIEFSRVEAISLLTSSTHIVRALAGELRIKRTMDGGQIDSCIERAVAAEAADDEHQRRDDWRQRQQSAALLDASIADAVSGERLSQAANRLQLWMWLRCVCGLSLRATMSSIMR